MFAVAMSLVLLISTTVLLYQFWTRAFVEREAGATATHPFPARPARPARIEGRTPASAPRYHVDHAA